MDRPVLIVVDGPVVIQSLTLEKGRYRIGRSSDCDLVLPSASVSRYHAVVEKVGNDFFIEDLKSTNGTKINGEMISRYQLKPGDEIEICDHKIIFDLKSPSASKTEMELRGGDTAKLEGIYQMIKNRIKNVNLKREFDKYHKLVKKSRRRLTDRVYLDSLTGVKNRGFFEKTISEYVRSGRDFSLLLIDIDHFKKVNDRYGHQRGDEVLRAVAFLMKNSCRKTDLCARYGGEEFAILFPDLDVRTAKKVAEDIRMTIKNRSQEITGIPITISIGIGHYPLHGGEKETILKAADQALYQSKETGRNRVTVYEI